MKLTNFQKLSGPEEESCVKLLLNLICNGTTENKKRDLPIIANFAPRLLFALSEADSEIKNLFETDPYLNEQWALHLKENKFHSNPIISFDNTMRLSTFSQYKGASLLNAYETYSDKDSINALEILYKACEIGMFDALIKRIKIHIKNIHTEKDPDKVESLISFIMNDASVLSNLYWSIGCIDAGMLLFHIIQFYFQTDRSKIAIERFFGPIMSFSWNLYDSKTRPFPIFVLERGMEYLYLAKLIANLPQSRAITQSHVFDDNPLTGLKGDLEDPAKFEASFLKILADLKIPLMDSFCTQAYEHARKILLEYHPNTVTQGASQKIL